MKLFKRVQSILSASINEMLDKAEDPQAMVNQMIRDMEQALADMREHTIAVVATAKATQRRLERVKAESEDLQQQIETAVKAQRDDVARLAGELFGCGGHAVSVCLQVVGGSPLHLHVDVLKGRRALYHNRPDGAGRATRRRHGHRELG